MLSALKVKGTQCGNALINAFNISQIEGRKESAHLHVATEHL